MTKQEYEILKVAFDNLQYEIIKSINKYKKETLEVINELKNDN